VSEEEFLYKSQATEGNGTPIIKNQLLSVSNIFVCLCDIGYTFLCVCEHIYNLIGRVNFTGNVSQVYKSHVKTSFVEL